MKIFKQFKLLWFYLTLEMVKEKANGKIQVRKRKQKGKIDGSLRITERKG